MSSGAAALDDVYAKLDWATRHHDDMLGLFEQFARPGSSDERPYGIKFHELDRPAGLIVARFIAEEPMPVEISLLAADLVHNARAALDHVLARLKEHFGGDVGHGSFPTWSSQALWEEKVANAGKRSPLRRLNQAARYHKVVGGERCPIVDTWWQTETGHIMISPLPGIVAGVVTESGEDAGTSQGLLTLRYPWPGMLRTLYREDERFLETYWSKFGRDIYFVGDASRRDEDGYFWVIGRVDDVLNVSGHRMSTAEIESAIVSHEKVAESAVIGQTDEDSGQSVTAFVTLSGDLEGDDDLISDIREHVARKIGKLARPRRIIWADDLPKTRSGKIMRRLATPPRGASWAMSRRCATPT